MTDRTVDEGRARAGEAEYTVYLSHTYHCATYRTGAFCLTANRLGGDGRKVRRAFTPSEGEAR
ncbi:hypothetical protein ABZ172_16530 [Streptomyces sp. NPDC006296]|uniref:hypothetical protein n=1 Tax=Streptomyces sp. NPDC006296 TaxID=3156746 RepID=UPI0033BD067A